MTPIGIGFGRDIERHAHMEGLVIFARLFGQIGKEVVMIDELGRAFLAARQLESDHRLSGFDRVREKPRGGACVLRRPVKLFFEGNASLGEQLGAGAAEAIDERAVAEVERVGELRNLRGRPIEIAVMEEELEAAEDLLRGAADKTND